MDFDLEINPTLMASRNPIAQAISTLYGGTVASIVDAGASIWNTLPGDDVDTEDILSRIGGDPLRVYQEHTDAVQLASLIGGSLLPGGIALKGMNILRNGARAPKWFSAAGKTARQDEMLELFQEGKQNTAQYKKLLWGDRAATVANNFADAGAAELAMLGSMAAHPLLEDYWEDPAKNFGLSLAIGGGLGAVGGIIVDGYKLSKATGEIESGILKKIYEEIRPTASIMPNTTQLQTNSISIQNLAGMLERGRGVNKIPENDLMMSMAEKMRKDLEVENGKLLDAMLDPTLRDLPLEEKQFILNELQTNSAMHGVQSVRSVTSKEILDRYAQGTLTSDPVLKVKTAAGEDKGVEAAYFADIKKFGSVKDIQHHAGAAALGMTEDQLVKSKNAKLSRIPNFDSSLESMSRTTPSIDGDFVSWTLKYDKMDEDEFLKHLDSALLSADDMPQLQAIATKMAGSPRLQNLGKVKIADRLEEANAVLAGVNAKRTLGGTPVKYQEALEKAVNNSTVDAIYDIRKTRPGSPAAKALDDWIGGNTFKLHKSATSYFSRGYAQRARGAADVADAKLVQDIYESAESKSLRSELMKLADKDGMIYAFRGVKTSKIAGQSPLESFAVTVDKTRQFTGASGRTMLYKIDVEDVVAAVHDIGPKGDNVELIVRPTARQAEATLDTQGRIKFREELERNLEQKAPVAMKAAMGDIYDLLKDGKFSLMKEMLKKGYSLDVVAKRVNMPVDSVRAFVSAGATRDIMDQIDVISYKTADMAREALSIKHKPLVLKGSLMKHDYTKGHANLNTTQLQQINQLATATLMAKSSAPAARQLQELFFQTYTDALASIRAGISNVNNSKAGSSFFSSADHMMRNMGDIGPIVSVIGKNITEISNQMEARIVRPLTDILVNIGDDVAALAELNVGYQVYSRLQGRRLYENRQFWQFVPGIDELTGKEILKKTAVTFEGREFKVVSDAVDEFFTKAGQAGRELFDMESTSDAIMGIGGRNDIGYWLPSMNPINKHVAYLHDKATDSTRMIYGRTAEELESGISSFADEILKSKGNLMVVRKGDQQWWNYTNGRSGSIYMQNIDSSKLRTGASASAIVPTDRAVLSELIGGYQHYINASVRRMAELSMSDIVDNLRRYSSTATGGFDAQPLGFIKKVTSKPKDAAADVINVLLGNPMLKEYEGWKTASNLFDTALTKGLETTQTIWRTMKRGLPSKMSEADMAKFNYEEFEQKLKEAGVLNPFENLDRAVAIEKFGLSNLGDNPDLSKRVIAASNGLVSTMALKFGELAHPLVNLMSMPILTSLANSRNLPERFMGVQRATREVSTTQVMYEGVRAMNSPRFKALNEKWEDLGYFKPLVSEATEAMQDARKFEKGAVATVERALNSSFMNIMGTPSDWSEALSRKITMNTGYQLGKRLYPELSDEGLTIFARDFMDKALGNYSAAQRPVMFQGTLGMAMGLFQTYMLTLAQNVYRNVEMRDWKTLLKGMLAQQSIFGFGSMPGFEPISKMIGDNFSEEHYDLTTGTYRAVGENADWILYGLPSNILGSGFFSRGSVDPRFPNVAAGLDNLAAYNILAQSGQFISNMARATGQGEDAGQAMLQAFSLQSMSRPIARVAELSMAATGEGGSINQAGQTVQTSDEVMTLNGIFSRVMATRPLQEAKLREMQRMNRFYEAADKDRREGIINKLRTAFRNGTNSPDKVAEIAEEYLREGGSPAGWRTAYRTAQARTNTPGMDTFIEDIDETNPLNHMIDSLD